VKLQLIQEQEWTDATARAREAWAVPSEYRGAYPCIGWPHCFCCRIMIPARVRRLKADLTVLRRATEMLGEYMEEVT
jgi:hypothetical protein